jgi:hypothetical protein
LVNFFENQLMGRDLTNADAEFYVRKYDNFNAVMQDNGMTQSLNIVKKVPVKALLRALQGYKTTLSIRANTEGMAKTALALKFIAKTLPGFNAISGTISQKEGINVVLGRPERSIRLISKVLFMTLDIIENDDTLDLSTPDEAFQYVSKETEEAVMKWSQETANPQGDVVSWANKLSSFTNKSKGTLREIQVKQTSNKEPENITANSRRKQYRSNSENRSRQKSPRQGRSWSTESYTPGRNGHYQSSYGENSNKMGKDQKWRSGRGTPNRQDSEERKEERYVPRGNRRSGNRGPRGSEEIRRPRRGTSQPRRGRGGRRLDGNGNPQRSERSKSPYDRGKRGRGSPRRRGRRRG